MATNFVTTTSGNLNHTSKLEKVNIRCGFCNREFDGKFTKHICSGKPKMIDKTKNCWLSPTDPFKYVYVFPKKTFKCDICQSVFANNDQLKAHLSLCNIKPSVLPPTFNHSIFKSILENTYNHNFNDSESNIMFTDHIETITADKPPNEFYIAEQNKLPMSHFGHEFKICPVSDIHETSKEKQCVNNVVGDSFYKNCKAVANHKLPIPTSPIKHCSKGNQTADKKLVTIENSSSFDVEFQKSNDQISRDPELNITGKTMKKEEVSFQPHDILSIHNYHLKSVPVQCKVCDRSFSSDELLKVHESRSHHDEYVQCEDCPKWFKNESLLKKHKCINRKRTKIKVYDCQFCTEFFTTNQKLTNHLVCHHINNLEKAIGCYTCDEKFLGKRSLRDHMNKVHAGKLNRRPKGPDVVCEYCNRSFKFPAMLVVHLRSHTGEKIFPCSMCPRSFSCKEGLKNHDNVHTGQKPFQCELCGKLFTSYGNLLKHKRSHKSSYDFMCSTCGVSFKQKEELSRHLRKHTKDPSSTCTFCERQFGDKKTLIKHLKLHEMHEFVCKVCSRGFDEEEEFDEHELYHINEHPFACDTCGKRFAVKQQLTSHEKCHTKEKPYKCPVCGKRYTWRSSFGHHRKSHL